MDTSEVYRRMCEKAEEIQKLKTPIIPVSLYRLSDGKILDGNTGDCIATVESNDCVLRYKYIWLPRQDQLQAMISEHFKAGLDLCNFYAWYMQNRPSDVAKEVDSMEQLWLAFVMHKKFGGKTWNGEAWVK